MTEQKRTGPYMGEDLTGEQADSLAILNINPKWLKLERGLLATRWFDYYDLHPTIATLHFAAAYRESYRWIIAKRIDVDAARYMRGFKGDDIFKLNPRELLGFWKARQSADRHGIPYDFYTRTVLKTADEALWRRMPRPTQMYNTEIVEIVKLSWDAETRAGIRLPKHEEYLPNNYRGARHQDAFREWLCERILTKPSPEFALYQFGLEEGWLSPEVIEKRFDKALIKRAYSLA